MSAPNGFQHNSLALVRLDAGRVELLPWPEELRMASKTALVGGAAAGERLLALYPDALVLASGPLTGAMTPGSGLLVASCAGKDENPTHTPFLLRHGPALKAAGVDFLVITGKAQAPTTLLVEHNSFRLNSASDLLGLDIFGMRARLSARRPDGRPSLLLCGPAGQRGLECASVGQEHGQSLDRGAVARWMGARNLLAAVLAGGGPLPGGAAKSPLFDALSPQRDAEGFLDVFSWSGGRNAGGVQGRRLASGRLGRVAACWLCPRPCLAFLAPAPPQNNGALCSDHLGLAALYDALGEAAPEALHACSRHGFDAQAASMLLKNAGAVPGACDGLLADWASGRSAPPATAPGPLAKSFPIAPRTEAESRAAAGLTLGICPILLQRCKDIPVDHWLEPLGQDARVKLDAALPALDV
jgi:hypothetical protein